MILEIGKYGPIGPLNFRNRGPLAHLGATVSIGVKNTVLKYEQLGQYWSKKDIIVHE